MAFNNRNQRLNGFNPLAYLGDNAYQPSEFVTDTRAPTTNDTNFELGTVWLYTDITVSPKTQKLYALVNLDSGIAKWALFSSGGGDLVELTADNGFTVNPDANGNIDVLGVTSVGGVATNINTIGSANTMGIALNNSISQPNTNAAGTAGLYSLGGDTFLHNYGSTPSNVFIGNNAGNLTNTGATSIGIGLQALRDLTSGTANVAVGTQALVRNTSGERNIAIGSSAANFITTGTDNIAIGQTALQNNNQSGNVAIGTAVLSSVGTDNNTGVGHDCMVNFSANDGIALGYRAMRSNLGGNQCIAIGNNSQFNNVGGSNNIGLGYHTLMGNPISGSDNIAMGVTALAANTSGASNIAIGTEALTNNTTASNNIAMGHQALAANTGSDNVAIGYQTLQTANTGSSNIAIGTNALNGGAGDDYNIAIGTDALALGTSSFENFAIGYAAMSGNVPTGSVNIAIGTFAMIVLDAGENNIGIGSATLSSLTDGNNNIAVGVGSLSGIVDGGNNTAIGDSAGQNLTANDSDNIIIGSLGSAGLNNTIIIGRPGTGQAEQNRCFIHGIRGITTGVNDAIAVLIDSAGQLGTVSSSIRFKENVKDMGSASDDVMKLRPVIFNYKKDSPSAIQFGLIAEEVEKVMPKLVVHEKTGEPYTVRYNELPAMLLNEIQKLNKRVEKLEQQGCCK